MSLESIGAASRVLPLEQPTNGVLFSIPYDSQPYYITLENEDLNRILQRGLSKVFLGESISGFDFDIRLPGGLPLYVGAVALGIYGKRHDLHEISMEVGVTSMSVAHEHRGVLRTERPKWSENWNYVGYQTQPPLTEFPEPLY